MKMELIGGSETSLRNYHSSCVKSQKNVGNIFRWIFGFRDLHAYCCWPFVIFGKNRRTKPYLYITGVNEITYRVIRKSLRDFRPMRHSSRDGHAEGEYVNSGRETPSFCPTLQVLDMSTLGHAADVNPVIKFLPHTFNVCGRYSYQFSYQVLVMQAFA